MADLKMGESFGLDANLISEINWELALARVINDLKTDFIYAPHINFIYRRAGDALLNDVKSALKSGKFNPDIPITIEVPKSYRLRVAVSSKRLGPNFSRPGSILLPYDRIFYQALADKATNIIDEKTNYARSFSHRIAENHDEAMFLPTRICWNDLQKSLRENSKNENIKYILKIDVSNYFGSINQHTLINTLNDVGYSKSLYSRLELILTSYTGDRSSRGLVQGIYPSDLFGNFYMSPVDRFLDDKNIPSARYVDDMYIFVESVEAADKLLRDLIPFLRSYDLVLNEAKCVIMPKTALMSEEPDLEKLFADAVEEISDQLNDEDMEADYGFQSEWDDGEEGDNEDNNLELFATQVLFDSIDDYPGQEENIERFCLPLFAKSGSDYALNHVIDSFKKRPSMTQIYASYLSKFLENKKASDCLLDLISDESSSDWQKMWAIGSLILKKPDDEKPIKYMLDILNNANKHEALRAVAAIYVGRHGDLVRRKLLISIYPSVSPYIKAAIFFSSNYWPGVEKSNAKASWSGHGSLNALISIGMAKK